MAIFVLLTSTRYITTKQIDSTEVDNGDGEEPTLYKHPFLQSVAGYLGEFLVVIALFFYYKRHEPAQLKTSDQVSYLTMAIPAFCDFTENILLIFATT